MNEIISSPTAVLFVKTLVVGLGFWTGYYLVTYVYTVITKKQP